MIGFSSNLHNLDSRFTFFYDLMTLYNKSWFRFNFFLIYFTNVGNFFVEVVLCGWSSNRERSFPDIKTRFRHFVTVAGS